MVTLVGFKLKGPTEVGPIRTKTILKVFFKKKQVPACDLILHGAEPEICNIENYSRPLREYSGWLSDCTKSTTLKIIISILIVPCLPLWNHWMVIWGSFPSTNFPCTIESAKSKKKKFFSAALVNQSKLQPSK